MLAEQDRHQYWGDVLREPSSLPLEQVKKHSISNERMNMPTQCRENTSKSRSCAPVSIWCRWNACSEVYLEASEDLTFLGSRAADALNGAALA